MVVFTLPPALEQSYHPDASRETECHSRQREASEGQMLETRDSASPGILFSRQLSPTDRCDC